jgi:5'-deoxynucleotidase YfbR-like HD superfamily hydrolase
MIEVKKLLNGDIRKSIHTTRYSTCAVHRVESVAEHVFNTMTYASVIAHYLADDCRYVIDHGQVLNKALFHDLEEPAGTGDILRKVKHSTEALQEEIQRIGIREVRRVAGELGMYKILEYWSTSKDATLEGQIVRVADGLSVAAYLVEEYRMGNRMMRDVHEEFVEYLDSLLHVPTPELADLVREVLEYFKESVEFEIASCQQCGHPLK